MFEKIFDNTKNNTDELQPSMVMQILCRIVNSLSNMS